MTCEQAASWLLIAWVVWAVMRVTLYVLKMRFDMEPTMKDQLDLPSNWMFTGAERTVFREWRYTVDCYRSGGSRLEISVTSRDEESCVSEIDTIVNDIEEARQVWIEKCDQLTKGDGDER